MASRTPASRARRRGTRCCPRASASTLMRVTSSPPSAARARRFSATCRVQMIAQQALRRRAARLGRQRPRGRVRAVVLANIVVHRSLACDRASAGVCGVAGPGPRNGAARHVVRRDRRLSSCERRLIHLAPAPLRPPGRSRRLRRMRGQIARPGPVRKARRSATRRRGQMNSRGRELDFFDGRARCAARTRLRVLRRFAASGSAAPPTPVARRRGRREVRRAARPRRDAALREPRLPVCG